MNEKYVVSLELSKKLAPYFPDAMFWWVKSLKQYVDLEDYEVTWRLHEKSFITKLDGSTILHEHHPALTTDELLERLPKIKIAKEDEFDDVYFVYTCGKWLDKDFGSINKSDKTLPNALARLFLWLVDEGIVVKGESHE